MVTKLPFAALQKIEKVGSVLPLAAGRTNGWSGMSRLSLHGA